VVVAKAAGKLEGYVLGLVPVVVGLVFGVLSLPRAVPPVDLPAPVARASVLRAIDDREHALASEPTPLPDDVRALGSAIRTYNTREAQQGVDPYATPQSMNEARTVLEHAAAPLLGSSEALLALRATQLDEFVAEVHAFERTGTESAELHALGGPFVRRMREVGWCSEHACSFDDEALRAMFRLAWNGLLHLERPPFALGLEEQRALYSFYLQHPHASETTRKRIDEARSSARTAKACAALVEAEAMAAEEWRAEKVKRLALIDPEYPAEYALGVLLYREKRFEASAESFRGWLETHPDGPWTLRARNYMRAALKEAGVN
jgi:hypothetical protein